MPSISLPYTPNPAIEEGYAPARTGRRGRPMLFQVTDPINRPIWGYLLALHVNPNSFSEKFMKSKNVVMTYGGFVEFIWPDELDSISASQSTGAFLGPFQGLTSGSEGASSDEKDRLYTKAAEHGRHGTMAWERNQDLIDLFRHNGNIFNGRGQPAVRGRVMCIYDRGVYIGHFATLAEKETDEKPFSFEVDWEFKVEETLYHFPVSRDIQLSSDKPLFVSGLEDSPPIDNLPTPPASQEPQVNPKDNQGSVNNAPPDEGTWEEARANLPDAE